MRTNFQTWLNSLTNDDGSGTTGDLLNVSWFTDQMDVIGGDLDDIDADITALQNVGFLSGYDSVVYTYKDTDTITIQAGGQFTVSDDSTMVKVAASTDLKLSTGRSTDCAAEAANTLYYIWGGLTSLGATAFYFHTSATAMPSELAKGKRIRGAVRNDNSSNILPFLMTSTHYHYNVSLISDGTDPTEVLDIAGGTSTWIDVDCSSVMPISSWLGYIAFNSNYQRIRPKGNTTEGFQIAVGIYPVLVDANRVFQTRNTQAYGQRMSLWGYAL